MPLTSKTFSQLIDFTRTSAATYVDQLGRIVPTPVSPNLLTFTQEFENAAWGKVGATVAANAASAPDGTFTADAVVEDTSTGTHDLSASVTITTGQIHTATFFLKASGRSLVRVMQTWNGTSDRVHADFDLANGTVGAAVVTGTASSVGAPVITSFGNGWYRCQVSGSCPTGTSVLSYARLMSASGVVSYTGSGTSGIFVWGAQLEQTPDANLTLGSERWADQTPTFTNFGGTNGAYNTSTKTMTNSGAAVGDHPRFYFDLGLTVGKIYRVSGTLTGSLSQVTRIRLAQAGTANDITFNSTTGVFFGYATAAVVGLDIVTNLDGAESLTISSISVREVTAASPSTYIRNFGGRFPPRFDYDPVTLAPRGLLIEEQRTNLLLRSEEFDNASWAKTATTVTANAATSPDGTVDADKLVETAATSTFHIAQTVTVTAGQTLTGYAYFKAGERQFGRILIGGAGWNAYAAFNLSTGVAGSATGNNSTGISASITPAGNGWYRCVVTATPPGGLTSANLTIATNGSIDPNANSYAGTAGSGLFIWGAQLEAGAFATSYIPTTSSQVTRTADSAAITGANFSPWYNQSEGTIYVEASAYAGTNVNRYYELSDGTSANLIQGFAGPSTIHAGWIDVGSAPQARLQASGSPTSVTKMAVAFKQNDFAASINGAAALTDTVGTVPTVNRLGIANAPNGAAPLNGHIRSLRFYPTRLTNAQLQALTA